MFSERAASQRTLYFPLHLRYVERNQHLEHETFTYIKIHVKSQHIFGTIRHIFLMHMVTIIFFCPYLDVYIPFVNIKEKHPRYQLVQ